MTFKVIKWNEALSVAGASLLVLTERMKYYKINIGLYVLVFIAYVKIVFTDIEGHNISLAMLHAAGILIVLAFIQYPINKLKENRNEKEI